MIKLSDDLMNYLNSTDKGVGQYVRVEILTKSGKSYSISDEELSGGTVRINKKSVSGSSFDIGECYINDATITIIDKSNKYSDNFNNAEMTIFFGVKNDSLSLNEEIQIGKFIVPTDTTVRKIASIQLTGDSILSKLDLSTNGVTTSGTPYALVSWCCDMCGVELALTEEEFNALSENTKYTFYINESSSISTYRDVIMYISQIIGGFATDTNDGKLTFKTYNTSNSVFSINNDTIASSRLGDSSYTLDGLSVSFNDKVIYINGDVNSEYMLELESNPLFDNLTEDLVVIICSNIWSQLSGVSFRSFDFQYNGNPAIECGDILNNDVRGLSSFITGLSWVYHGKSSVAGAILDKRIKTQSQNIKKAASTGGGSKNELSIVKYINTDEYELGSLESKVTQMYFTLPSGVSPLFSFAMIVKNELAGLVSLKIIYDNVEMILKPKFQCSLGYHTLSFTKSFDAVDYDMTHSLSVYATFISDSGQEFEYKVPCLVDIYGIEANIIGYKASSGEQSWNGRYEFTDSIGLITIGNDSIKLNSFSISSPIMSYKVTDVCELTDGIDLISIDSSNINILPFSVSEPTFSLDVAPVYVTTQMSASDAVLSGSCELRSNSSALSGDDIDFIGNYPDNGAVWSINLDVDTRINLSIKAASGDNRYLDVYIDDVLVSDNLLYNNGSYTNGVEKEVVTDYALSSGNHTIGVGNDTGNYAPLVDYIIVKYEI